MFECPLLQKLLAPFIVSLLLLPFSFLSPPPLSLYAQLASNINLDAAALRTSYLRFPAALLAPSVSISHVLVCGIGGLTHELALITASSAWAKHCNPLLWSCPAGCRATPALCFCKDTEEWIVDPAGVFVVGPSQRQSSAAMSSVEDDYDENQQAIDSYDEDDGQQQQDGGDDDENLDYAVDSFLKPLTLQDTTLYQLACRFSQVYGDLARNSDQQFLPTPVTRLPTGNETGRYLAIDVGGSNLRVAFIDLIGQAADEDEGSKTPEGSKENLLRTRKHRVRRTLEKSWPIGEHLKMDKAEDLFLWIGDCMAEVVATSLSADVANGVDVPEQLEMGITFSFPMM